MIVYDALPFSAKTILKIYDGEVADPTVCKNIEIPRSARASNVLVSIERSEIGILISIMTFFSGPVQRSNFIYVTESIVSFAAVFRFVTQRSSPQNTCSDWLFHNGANGFRIWEPNSDWSGKGKECSSKESSRFVGRNVA